MRTLKYFTWILAFIFSCSIINCQTSCRVLKPEISGNYVGSCKSGLANGSGEATGEDFYRGEFKEGLPNGKGTYIWKNGATYKGDWKNGMRDGTGTYSSQVNGKDSVLVGKWKNDRYMGNPNALEYQVDYRNNIGRVSFVKIGERPFVQYKFSRNGAESTNISNLLLQGSSGTESLRVTFTGFDQATFPFQGKVNFEAPSSFYTTILTCELRFKIFAPGSWVVTIFY
jgi:hypothetical protein